MQHIDLGCLLSTGTVYPLIPVMAMPPTINAREEKTASGGIEIRQVIAMMDCISTPCMPLNWDNPSVSVYFV